MKLGHIVGAAFAVVAWAFFPGCSKDSPSPELGIEGESCQQHTDCSSGLQCLNGACSHTTAVDTEAGVETGALVVHSQAGESCGARIDCVVGLLCINNVCTADGDSDAGEQTGAGKRGESCRSRGDCTAGLACVSGICAKADFGIKPTANECVQIDCVKAEDCCPKITVVDPSCTTYQSGCEGGITTYCTYYNMYCKCNPDAYTCTADNKCLSKTACTDAAFSCPSGFFCNGGTECVKCLKNEDCAADQTCTPQHTCLAKCSKNSDCPYLQTCNAASGACVDTGCTDDRECIAKTRSPLSVCTGMKCKTPCQTDAECNIGGGYQYSACVADFCQDVGCKTDEECRIRLNIPVPSNKQAKCQPKK